MDIKKQIANIQKSAASNQRWKQDAEIEITDHALAGVDKLFKSILPHFPAWRQTCKTDDELGRLKLAWTKALIRNKQKTGKNLDLKAGILACEESDSDWLPSVGKFIKMCGTGDGTEELANRAYSLFINREKQIDSVGLMVTSKHGFDLRKMNCDDCEKRFVKYYLLYAADNAIEPIESALIADKVELTTEQQKEADNRAQAAQSDFLKQFSCIAEKKHDNSNKNQVKPGLSKVQPVSTKSTAQLEKEKERQLKAIKSKL